MSEKTAVQEAKLFGKWSFEGIKVEDMGLSKYINLKPVTIPHSSGKHEAQRFKKSEISIVERLVNHLMRPGKNAGKKARIIQVVKNAFEIIALKTGRNPIEILVRAVENAAPCEDTTRISYGGIVYHVAVDVSPQRRVDLALRFLAEGARKAAMGNIRTVDECLAEELILAAQKDSRSYAVAKRNEQERIALASR
ncbi:30S ribosomal protein S7 [Candidatus Hecatella orcuttiae]|uniref:30S ribosomal protein S7 n=1 Tax=Candidatus Hecatella orcuttiae TaxID=1935119 RepID=UPI002867B671|nr:30S ribosomal protein S7 [Candidatus Hecatella orcuttiae]